MKDYPVNPTDEAKSAKLLDAAPIIYMPNVAVTGFIDEDDEPNIVISFSDDRGQVLNFYIGPECAEDVGTSLIQASQRTKEILGEVGGQPT